MKKDPDKPTPFDEIEDDHTILINDSLEDFEFGPLPVAPDGSFVPATQVFESDPIPEATEENFICLRGPCRHYLEQVPFFAAGNTKGTLPQPMKLYKRTCMRIAGFEVDLTDEVMAECNWWDPLMPEEMAPILARRERYYQIRKQKEESK